MQNKLCNILVPVDFTNKNKRAIDKAIEMANQTNCNIHLVNIVQPGFFSSITPYESRVDRLNSYDKLKDMSLSYSNQLYGNGKIEISLLEGNTTNKLAEYIRDFEMDMVVLGLSSNNLFQRRISSSAINKIAKKANVPVLAIGSNLIMIKNPVEANKIPRWWNKFYNKILSYGSEIPVMTMSNQ